MCPTGTGQRCFRTEEFQDRGVSGQWCFRTEVIQDRDVSGQRCIPQAHDSGEPGLTLGRITACVKKLLPIPASPHNVWKWIKCEHASKIMDVTDGWPVWHVCNIWTSTQRLADGHWCNTWSAQRLAIGQWCNIEVWPVVKGVILLWKCLKTGQWSLVCYVKAGAQSLAGQWRLALSVDRQTHTSDRNTYTYSPRVAGCCLSLRVLPKSWDTA